MARESRLKIDASAGLHDLVRPRNGGFRFQTTHAPEQIEEISKNLDTLVLNTLSKVPRRESGFRLDRGTDTIAQNPESILERRLFDRWGVHRTKPGDFLPICPRFQTYQFPLKRIRGDASWGKIDLLGIGPDGLPVPIELKVGASPEPPVRALVEVAAYGFALRECWPHLRKEWCQYEDRKHLLTADLSRIYLLILAPEPYYARHSCASLKGLLDALGTWFDIHFAALDAVDNARLLP